MAVYGKYKSIEPSSITSAVSSLSKDLSTSKAELSALNSSVQDEGSWKASAKSSLTKAFGKIESEVYGDIEKNLSTLTEVAGLIKEYKDAEKKALDYKDQLKGLDSEKDKAKISSLNTMIKEQEQIMEAKVAAIEAKC